MDWKIKSITKNCIFSKVKFIIDKSQLQDYEKIINWISTCKTLCNNIIKRPLVMSKHFGIQPKNGTYINQ